MRDTNTLWKSLDNRNNVSNLGLYIKMQFELFICNTEKKVSNATIKETVAIILSIISIIIASAERPNPPVGSEIPLVNHRIGWSYSLIFLPGAISVVYLFAYGQGNA